MRGKSLLNEKAIIILSLNQSECRKLLRSASSRIGFSRDTGIEESACKSSCRPLLLAIDEIQTASSTPIRHCPSHITLVIENMRAEMENYGIICQSLLFQYTDHSHIVSILHFCPCFYHDTQLVSNTEVYLVRHVAILSEPFTCLQDVILNVISSARPSVSYKCDCLGHVKVKPDSFRFSCTCNHGVVADY